MFQNRNLVIVAGSIGAVVLVGGTVYGLQKFSYAQLQKTALSNLEGGNYASALSAYDKLKGTAADATEFDEKIKETTAFLVAEENFKKAQKAAALGEWFGAKVLLQESDALKNPSFKYYEAAQELYKQAEALVQNTEHKTASKINDLEKSAALEKTKRQSVEKSKTQLEGELSNKSRALETSQQLIQESSKQLGESQQKILETEAQVKAEQIRTAAAAAETAKEKFKKFLTELVVYKDMGVKGSDQLQNAVSEIDGKRDVTALIYVSQGKILFDEALSKSQSLRSSAGDYLSRVDELITALNRLIESSKNLRTAAAYIDDQSSSDFTNNFSKGKDALADGKSQLGSVGQFINANR